MSNNSNNVAVNNPLKHVKSPRLKRNKGSRYLLPKLRFSNNVEERHIPYNKNNNYKTPHNIYLGRKGFRGKHRTSINVNTTNKRHMSPGLSENEVSKYRKNTLRKLKNKNNLFLNGGMVEKVNPLVEKKLENLYNQRKSFVKTMNMTNRKNLTKLNTLNLRIKNFVKNGYRGLRGSTRRIMNKVNNNLRG
jgi:hypothetical protein